MRAALAVVSLVVLIAACGPDIPSPTPFVPSPRASASTLESPVDGVIVAVDASGVSDVRRFTLRTSGGMAFDFVLGDLENSTEFPPSHLAEHQATSSPVRVYFREENGGRVVYRLEDAPG